MQDHIEIKYRTWYRGQAPQKIKLKIPGWSGNPGYHDGVEPQPWHCKPFVDASTYGLELLYPFETECHVVNENGNVSFLGDFYEESKKCSLQLPPFTCFAPHHYGFTSLLDIMTPENIITRIEPHPKFYTDTTDTTPIPVPGHLESEWWSRIFFLVFKTPPPNHVHKFVPGEPYAQLIFLPKTINYDVVHMNPSEETKRMTRDKLIGENNNKIANHVYYDHNQNRFLDTYKTLSKYQEKHGTESLDDKLRSIAEPKRSTKSFSKCPINKRQKS